MVIVSLFMMGCSEEIDGPANVQLAGTNENGRSYRISHAEVSLDAISGRVELDECVKDNTRIYYPNGTFEENEGRQKCNKDDPFGFEGTWSINKSETELLLTIGDSVAIWQIVGISPQKHKLSRPSDKGTVSYVLERI